MFTNKDLESIDRDYFIVHNATCGNIILQSKCTGHYWSISGAGYEDQVTLKHKHKREYEWHEQALYIKTHHDLKGTIEAIKAHDAYALKTHQHVYPVS